MSNGPKKQIIMHAAMLYVSTDFSLSGGSFGP